MCVYSQVIYFTLSRSQELETFCIAFKQAIDMFYTHNINHFTNKQNPAC